MERTETRTPDIEPVIAPGEIRELVARLTEQSVEAVPAHESRTLEGLALETGIPLLRLRETLEEMRRQRRFTVPPIAWVAFAGLAIFGCWAASRPATPVVIPTETVSSLEPKADTGVDLDGTVPLSAVTYGPDAGNFSVDPTFSPTTALPDGLSISATAGNVLWGSGDHRAKVIDKSFTPEEEKSIEANVAELLNFVRQSAAQRRVPTHKSAAGFPVFDTNLLSDMYFGGGSPSMSLPVPGPAGDKMASAIIAHAAKDLVVRLQTQLRQQESSHRFYGP